MTETKRSQLYEVHLALGAKMVPFGGWEMPLSYPEGTLAEHMACRRDAAIFDVSHLGSVRVSGRDALAILQQTFSNDLRRIGIGQTQYSHLLDPEDASVEDDVIIWWVGEDCFEVMPNASNTSRVQLALEEAVRQPDTAAPNLVIQETTTSRALIAAQGPNARSKLATLSAGAAAVGRNRVGEATIAGEPIIVAGTGYTGEDGVEISCEAADAETIWQTLLDAGLTPAGLGARDTLRLESALPLHGHELGEGITSTQAGLGWAVRPDKGDFRGRQAYLKRTQTTSSKIIKGLMLEGRRPPRQGQTVWRDGREIGYVTSGNFSPILKRGIALALLPADLEPESEVAIEMRGQFQKASVTTLPFVG